MGTVYHKQTTRPLPTGAELIEKDGRTRARWRRRGKWKSAPVTTGRGGQQRIVTTSPVWAAKYRDGSGAVREVTTGCRDETAARQELARLMREAELVKAG